MARAQSSEASAPEEWGASLDEAEHRLYPPRLPDAALDIVAVAASAGGMQALRQLLTGLPSDFPAAVLVVRRPISWRRDSDYSYLLPPQACSAQDSMSA